MLMLIFMLAYANCVTSFPKGWKVIVASAFLIVAKSFSGLTSVMMIIRAKILNVVKFMIFRFIKLQLQWGRLLAVHNINRRNTMKFFLVGCVEIFRPNKRFGVYSSAASSRLMFCIPLVRYLYCVSGFALLSNKCAFIGIFISTVLTLPSRP